MAQDALLLEDALIDSNSLSSPAEPSTEETESIGKSPVPSEMMPVSRRGEENERLLLLRTAESVI